MSKKNSNNKGFFSARFFIYSAIFCIIAYCGFWTGRFYVDYYTIKDTARNLFLDAHLKTDKQIVGDLQKKISYLGTPIFSDDIKIIRGNGKVNLKITYSEYLFIGDFPLLKFNFAIDETRYFKK